MLVVSDTSFCSNNLKNVWFIFKMKFCWHSLDVAVEIISLFLTTYMTKLLHCSRTESHCTYALSLFSSKMLFGIFRAYSRVAVYFLTITDTDLFRYHNFKGPSWLSFPGWCSWQPRNIQTKTHLLLNTTDFHSKLWRPDSPDYLLMISKGLMCKTCKQLTLVTNYTGIQGSNCWANELMNCSTLSHAARSVEGQCETPTDAFESQIKVQLL